MKKFLSTTLLLTLVASLAACSPVSDPIGGNSTVTGTDATFEQVPPQNNVDTSFTAAAGDMFSGRDSRTEYENPILIELKETTAACDSQNVSISGSSLTIRAEGTYLLRGKLTGAIYVNAPDLAKLQLVLDGVTIHNPTGAALCVIGGDKVFVTLAGSSKNELSSGEKFTPLGSENIDGAVYSKQDITFNGTGELTVSSPAGNAIVGNDDVVITGGTYTLQAAEHGIDANDSVRLTGAALAITAGKDAIHVENNSDATRGFFYMQSGTLSATVQGDGIDASGYVQLDGGTLSLTCGGGAENGEQHASGMGGPGGKPGWSAPTSANDQNTASAKGIKSASTLLVNAGTLAIDSADDALHANSSVVIGGGTLELSTGDDALHADAYLTVSGGVVNVKKSYEGIEAQDVEICGGEMVLICTDDGINAAGGKDESGFGGMGGDAFGGRGPGGPGGMSAGNGSVRISGGSLYINASGDGIDANGTLTITGGLTTVCGPTRGDTAVLDYDKTGVISGGTFIGTGSQMMAQTLASEAQGVISLSVGNRAAGTPIVLTAADGEVLLSYEPAMSYQIVIISTPSLQKGATYVVSIGGESGEYEAK
jgi:hypothetical protein